MSMPATEPRRPYRPRREVGQHLPRNRGMTATVDAEIEAAVVAEARRRGLTKGSLLAELVEACVEGDLFNAVLGDCKMG